MLLLPGEVICESKLPHLSVCDLQAHDTAFTNKCVRPQLRQVWKSYQYDTLDVVLNDYDFEWLSGIGVHIIALNEHAFESDFRAINIPTLKKLHIKSRYSSTIDSVNLLYLAARCPELEELVVSPSFGSNNDNAIPALAQNCSQLHTLHIGSVHLTEASIQVLCDNCPHLKHIRLSYCHNLTDASLIAIANSYPHLQSIHLSWRGKFISVTAVSAIAEHCPLISELTISNHSVKDACMYVIAQHCRNLTKLNISNTSISSADAMISVIKSCPMLREIVCYNCFKEVKDRVEIEKWCHRVQAKM